MKHEISREENWQLMGLLALAKVSVDRLAEIEQSIREVLHVTEEDEGVSGVGDPQHIGDAIYGGYSMRELLSKLGVVLSKTTKKGSK